MRPARGAGVAIAAVMTWGVIAHADQVDACVEAADRAQQLRDKGKLIDARTQLLACGASSCPGAVAKQCVRWLHEVDDELPTLSLRVRDGAVDVTDVEVLVDDASRMKSLDGRPIPIDPGAHRLALRRNGVTVEQSIVARAGEKNRLVDVQLTPETSKVVIVTTAPPAEITPPPVGAKRGFRFPWTSGLFLGIGVASFAVTVPLVIVAGNDAQNLRQTCAPACAGSAVDDVRTKLIVANVTFGVGVAGLALSALTLVIANMGHPSEKPALSFGVTPMAHGASASAVGFF